MRRGQPLRAGTYNEHLVYRHHSPRLSRSTLHSVSPRRPSLTSRHQRSMLRTCSVERAVDEPTYSQVRCETFDLNEYHQSCYEIWPPNSPPSHISAVPRRFKCSIRGGTVRMYACSGKSLPPETPAGWRSSQGSDKLENAKNHISGSRPDSARAHLELGSKPSYWT